MFSHKLEVAVVFIKVISEGLHYCFVTYLEALDSVESHEQTAIKGLFGTVINLGEDILVLVIVAVGEVVVDLVVDFKEQFFLSLFLG